MSNWCADNKHKFDESGSCSICGLRRKVAGSKRKPAPNPVRVSESESTQAKTLTYCPDCGMERENQTVDCCEICRYNFMTMMPFNGIIDDTTISPQSYNNSMLERRWEIVAKIDATLHEDQGISAPMDEPERLFHLDLAENLVGRRNHSKRIYPEIPLTDPGISHRHCKIIQEFDGTIYLLELGSKNGTLLNGVQLEPGVKQRLRAGDEIVLGCWTKLTIRRV